MPKELHTDNVSEFRNNLIVICVPFLKLCRFLEDLIIRQSQGQTEKYNYTLKRVLLSTMVHKNTRNWLFVLDQTVYSYNINSKNPINNTPVMHFMGFKVLTTI